MPAPNEPNAELDVLSQRLAALERSTIALETAHAASRRLRRFILLAIIVLLAGVVARIAYGVQKVMKNTEPLLATAQDRANKNMDDFMKELQKLVDNTRPTVQTAFLEQSKKDLPHYMKAITEQREAFVKNLQGQLQTKMAEHQKNLVAKHRRVLEEEFPKIQDPRKIDNMMDNFQFATQKLASRYYAGEFRRQMDRLFSSIESLPPADLPPKGDRPPAELLAEELVGHLMEVLKLKMLQGPSPIVPETRKSQS